MIESLQADDRAVHSRGEISVSRIVAFLDAVPIPVIVERVAEPTFMPGITVRDGALVYDPERLTWPGDLLHEAGHIAVTEAPRRAGLNVVSPDPADEMAALAWSYAAARAIGLDAEIVFHAGGYGGDGGGEALARAFDSGGGPGVPMLQWFGMVGDAGFPAMRRWLR